MNTESAIKALAAELEVEESEITVAEYSHYNGGLILKVSDGSEYAVYEDIDAAEAAAIEANRSLIEDEDCLPNLPLEDYIADWWVDELASEEGDFHASEGGPYDRNGEGKTEEEVRDALEEAFIEAFEDNTSEDIPTEVQEKLKAAIYEAVSHVAFDKNEDGKTEDEVREEYEENIKSDPVGYLKEFYSDEDLAKKLQEEGALDIDAMAEECVRIDGIPHLLASYDGSELDLDEGFIAFRLN